MERFGWVREVLPWKSEVPEKEEFGGFASVNTLATRLNCFDRKFLQNVHNADQDAGSRLFEDGPSQRREQQVGLLLQR